MRISNPATFWLLVLAPLLLPLRAGALELSDLKGEWSGIIFGTENPAEGNAPASISFIDLKGAPLTPRIRQMFDPREEIGGMYLRQNFLSPIRNLKIIDDTHIGMTVQSIGHPERSADIKAVLSDGVLKLGIPPMLSEAPVTLELRKSPGTKLTDAQMSGSYVGDMLVYGARPDGINITQHVELILEIRDASAKVEIGTRIHYKLVGADGKEKLIDKPGKGSISEVQRIGDRIFLFGKSGDGSVPGFLSARIYPDRLSFVGMMDDFASGYGDLKRIDKD